MLETKKKKISLKNLDTIFFDFDGVLTDNKVYINQQGEEMVQCNRADGLAFEVIKKLKINCFILSTEKSDIVLTRAKKLKISAFNNLSDKFLKVEELAKLKNFSISRSLYIGNDLNDYKAMNLCGYSACPSDSHKNVKGIASHLLKSKGGQGVAREVVEDVLGLNLDEILF